MVFCWVCKGYFALRIVRSFVVFHEITSLVDSLEALLNCLKAEDREFVDVAKVSGKQISLASKMGCMIYIHTRLTQSPPNDDQHGQ